MELFHCSLFLPLYHPWYHFTGAVHYVLGWQRRREEGTEGPKRITCPISSTCLLSFMWSPELGIFVPTCRPRGQSDSIKGLLFASCCLLSTSIPYSLMSVSLLTLYSTWVAFPGLHLFLLKSGTSCSSRSNHCSWELSFLWALLWPSLMSYFLFMCVAHLP